MVHILLTILKFLGIVLLVLLSVLLLLLLILLFGPIRYEAEGKADGQTALKTGISWLFFVLRCSISYTETGIVWFVRLFGVLIASNDEGFKKKKEEQQEIEHKKIEQKLPEKETQKQENVQKKEQIPREPAEPAEGKEPVSENSITKKKKSTLKQKIQKLKESVKRLIQNIKQIPEKIRSLKRKAEEWAEKGKAYREFFFSEANKKVFSFVLEKGKKMMLHILPHHFQGRVEFGMEDPYVMGQILAVLGMLLPVYEDKLTIIPDFEESKLMGEFSLKGRIIPGYLLFQLLCILLNKEFRRLVRDGRTLIGGKQ